MPEAFDWLTPSPFWTETPDEMTRPSFFRPVVLEFASDDFMQDLQTAAARATALRKAVVAPGAAGPARLFQPIHGRFYVACASLACRLPGFPDRELRRGDGERAFFVLRKLAGGAELGWVASGPAKGWRPLGARADVVLDGEEPMAAFPVAAGNGRTLHAAYLPVTSRETYRTAAADSPVESSIDPRLATLEGTFEAMRRILHRRTTEPNPVHASNFVLLELALFLEREAPLVYAALPDGVPRPSDPGAAALVDYLRGKSNAEPIRLASAIAEAGRKRDAIGGLLPHRSPPVPWDLGGFNLAADVPANPDTAGAFELALTAGLPARDQRAAPSAVEIGKFARQAGDRYVVRGVYRRPQCEPPQHWVGRPSEPFELAPVFDPDAPARPIRVALPEDVSVAALRKYAKGVAFSVSQELQGQVNRMSPGVLKGDAPGAFQLPNVGFICSLSIPIITICAFILLMIIVSLLDIVFRWMPYFQICFPLKPGTRAS